MAFTVFPYIIIYADVVINLCDEIFLHYMPKFLQDHIASVKRSASSLHALPNQDDFALGEGVDFTIDADRLVKIDI